MPSLANVRVLNPSLYARTSTFQTVVPFAPGATFNVSSLALAGAEVSEFEAFGRRWPDGSIRFARCWGRVSMSPGQTIELPVEVAPVQSAEREPFVIPDAVILGLLPADAGSVSETDRVSLHTESSYQIGPMWAKWHLRQDVHQGVVHWSLTVGYSDPRSRDLWVQLLDPVEISMPLSHGLVEVCWGGQKGVSTRLVGGAPGGSLVTTFLPAGFKIAHGQAHAWQGVVTTAEHYPAERKPLYAVATNWGDAGCGPLRIRPEFPAWMPSEIHVRVACERKILQRDGHPRRDPCFEPAYGLGKTSGEAGAQDDFGVIHGNAGFLGIPEWLDLAIPDCLQEWCRPTHFRESDARPVRAAVHPQLNLWMGRPHRMLNVSPDQLGKPHEDSWDRNGLRADYDAARQGWEGLDPQHTSLLLLTATAMQTGDYQLFDLLDDYAETFLASYTLPSTHPGYFSSGMDAARAVGRLGYAASWIDLLLARDDLRERSEARVSQVVLPVWRATAGRDVRPLDIVDRVNLAKYTDGSGRPLPVQPREWHPWQEGIALHGLACIGTPEALDVAQGIGETLVMHGWQDRGAYSQVAKAIEWTGDPVPTDENPLRFISGDGTEYRLWVLAAMQWIAATAGRPEVRARAAAILASIRPNMPTDGFFGTFDRYSIGGGQ